jgi:hypothetical protein
VAYWLINPEETQVEFAIAAQTTGFVGFGFNFIKGMPGSDVYVFRSINSIFVLEDRHGDDYNPPILDTTNDLTFIAGGRDKGITWFKFSRMLKNCDKDDLQFVDPSVVIYTLCSFGSSDDFSYHGTSNREATQMTLLTILEPNIPIDTPYLLIPTPSVLVPNLYGSYGCSYHVLPADQKYHLIKYRLLRGTSDTAGILHHVNMNICPSAPQGLVPGQAVSCDLVMGSCNQALLSGGYGPNGDTLPSDIGIPIGLGAAQHVIISRHFYNPAALSNVYDNGTGYEIWYTSQLRPYEIGQLALGTTQFTIPPNTDDYAVNALCSSSCTSNFPQGGLTVTSIFFHMHKIGARIYTKVIRSGAEVIELGRVDPWDPSSPGQNTYFKLLPGDTLITTCVYSNPNPKSVVFGSELTDEMCLATLTYYPKIELYQCADLPEGLGKNYTLPPACSSFICIFLLVNHAMELYPGLIVLTI